MILTSLTQSCDCVHAVVLQAALAILHDLYVNEDDAEAKSVLSQKLNTYIEKAEQVGDVVLLID